MHEQTTESLDGKNQKGHAKSLTHPLVQTHSPQVNQAILHS